MEIILTEKDISIKKNNYSRNNTEIEVYTLCSNLDKSSFKVHDKIYLNFNIISTINKYFDNKYDTIITSYRPYYFYKDINDDIISNINHDNYIDGEQSIYLSKTLLNDNPYCDLRIKGIKTIFERNNTSTSDVLDLYNFNEDELNSINILADNNINYRDLIDKITNKNVLYIALLPLRNYPYYLDIESIIDQYAPKKIDVIYL